MIWSEYLAMLVALVSMDYGPSSDRLVFAPNRFIVPLSPPFYELRTNAGLAVDWLQKYQA